MNVKSNYIYVIVVLAYMVPLCIQTTSPTTKITFQRCILHLYVTLPRVKISEKHEFSWPWALTVLFTNLYSIGSGYDKNSIFHTRIGNTHGHMQWVIKLLCLQQFLRYEVIVRT